MKAVRILQRISLSVAFGLICAFAAFAQTENPPTRERVAPTEIKTDSTETKTDSTTDSTGKVEPTPTPTPVVSDDKTAETKPEEIENVVPYYENYLKEYRLGPNDVITVEVFGQCPDYCKLGITVPPTARISYPLIREGVLVDLQTNRETAHYIGQNFSRGCTFATSWRNYPFLRMPNVHVEPGPAGSPTPEEMIADTKDGVLIDGRGSYSIDQQRFNGQFGGDAFWEVKNGKKTRMVTNVTYNAITTDFWGNLDAISGKESWRMFGTGGDAKGQPTQTNSISHGSPYLCIRKILVGAAFD